MKIYNNQLILRHFNLLTRVCCTIFGGNSAPTYENNIMIKLIWLYTLYFTVRQFIDCFSISFSKYFIKVQ